jgi:flavorubredoxin
MKLWPHKRWKQVLLFFFLAVVALSAILGIYAALTLNKDVVSDIDAINPGGSKSALIVYQPGLTSFPHDVSHAFGNGLAASGWSVELTTASSQTPSNLTKYSLLVLGFPCYGGTPGTAIVRYVDRLTNLQGIDTVIIACAAGTTGGSVDTMKQKVQAAGGTFKESLTLFTIAPNTGGGSATDIARQAGAQIQP